MRNDDDGTTTTPELIENGAALATMREDLDIQVATARKFPRSVEKFIQRIDTLACRNEDTAEAMFYSVPRKKDGKLISIVGPSVRFAEFVASEWGNIRYGGTPIGEDGHGFVICRGVGWDIEKNVAVTFDVKRRITTSDGRRYSDDMIMTTSNAGSSIALRNAVLRCVPQAYWKPIFEKARAVAVGKTSSFVGVRDKVLARLQALGVFPPMVFAHLGIAGVNDLTAAHVETLIGRGTAIKDGELTIEEAFPPVNTETGEIPMPQAKPAAAPAPAAAPVPQQPAAPQASTTVSASASTPSPAPTTESKGASAGRRAGQAAADTKLVQPNQAPPPAKPAPVVAAPTPATDIEPDPNDPSAAFDDRDPEPPAAVVEDGPIAEPERKAIFGALKRGGKTVPDLKAYLTGIGVPNGKSENVKRSQYAALIAWAETPAAREPGQEG